MRLMNQEKAGYFPLPPVVGDTIATYFASPPGARILDPCAGEGAALHQLAQLHQMEPFGIELNTERAAAAQQLISEENMLQDSYQNLNVPPGSFSVLYNNPPYLFVEDKTLGRAEYQWLRDTRPHLAPGGLLIYVVPRHMLKHRETSKYLCTWFDKLRVFRFPDGLYERFKQVIVFGIRREKAGIADSERVDKLKGMGKAELDIPSLTTQAKWTYLVPPRPERPFHFRSLFVSPRRAFTEALKHGIATGDEFQKHLAPTSAMQPLTPLAPLKIGHMNSVIAAGHLNNQLLEDEEQSFLIKGQSYKRIIQHTAEQCTLKGTEITNTFTEQVVTKITTLSPEGEIVQRDGADLESFLTTWLPNLTDIVTKAYPPRYQFDLNGYGPTLSALNQGRLIPLVGKPGLLPAQSHAAAAIATQLKTRRAAIVVGEMGTGKTLMGIAIAACIKAKHTIILCPPHLVDKWIRESKVVWPSAEAMALKTISDIDTFFAHPGPIIGVMKETSARSATGWSHAFTWFGPTTMSTRGKDDEWSFTRSSRRAPQTEDEFSVLASRLDPMARHIVARCPTCGEAVPFGWPSELQRNQFHCHACNAPLFQDERRRTKSQKPGSFARYAENERIARVMLKEWGHVGHGDLHRWQGTAVSDHFGYARYPLATYIQRHYKRRLDLLLADEVHQFKGAGSDRGYAFQRLVTAAKKTVGLTGTIYGGKASSLFYLLYRLVPEMKQFYDHTDVKKWVEHFGIMQQEEKTYKDEDGRLTGNNRTRPKIKELPGGSPAMLPWLLNRAVFVSLQDMGFALPAYEEIPVSVPMSSHQDIMYRSLKDQLMQELSERLIRNDKSLLAGYLQALLCWPDSPWRAKVVRDPKTEEIVAEIPGLPADQLYPKEEMIIEQIEEELANNRKVLLLCQQTGTLDITPQWVEMLTGRGIQTAVLKCEPSRREAWVKQQVEKGVQVIITHPKRVETGLDLLEFPTIIWMGTEYSVYTVMQASRRSWRIGQTQPVKVYFYCYEETLQEDALSLIAAKVAATLRVNGDSIESDSLADMDALASTDIITALARIATGQQARTESLQAAFQKANEAFHSDNTIIGEYEMIDTLADTPAVTETAVPQPGQSQPVTATAVPRPAQSQITFTKRPLDMEARLTQAVANALTTDRSALIPKQNGHSIMPISIPTTNLTFHNIASWCNAYEEILRRKDSTTKYAQETAAIEALPIWMCENAEDDENAVRAVELLEKARPPQGMRENAPTTPRINALKNRIQHGVKLGRKNQQPAPNGAEPAKPTRLVFGLSDIHKAKRKPKPAPATQLSLFG